MACPGAKRWSFPGAFVQSIPAMANGVVYICSEDKNNIVYALNAATGAEKWSFSATNGGTGSSPAVANGVVYVGSYDGNVYAFGLAGGLATPARPNRNSLHPELQPPQQR
jgi:outer membrane protein assembly factor BamB